MNFLYVPKLRVEYTPPGTPPGTSKFGGGKLTVGIYAKPLVSCRTTSGRHVKRSGSQIQNYVIQPPTAPVGYKKRARRPPQSLF